MSNHYMKEYKNSLDDDLVGDFKLIVESNDETEETPTHSGATTPLNEETPPNAFKKKWPRKYRQWNIVPWFLICISLWQLTFYLIANNCIYQRLMFTPEHCTDQYWRYITYTLLHSDLIHLVLNICLQCMIGLVLECEQGHWRVAFIYAIGGVSGSLATALFQPQLSLLGASAAVYALLMSHIPHLIKNFPHLAHRFLRIVALMVLCLSDVGFTLFHFLVNHNLNPRICLEAHIAGATVGLCLGFLAYKRVGPEGV